MVSMVSFLPNSPTPFDLFQERHMGESVVEAMQPQLRSRYLQLRDMNSSLLQQLDSMQQQLDVLNQRKSALEDDLSLSKVNIHDN